MDEANPIRSMLLAGKNRIAFTEFDKTASQPSRSTAMERAFRRLGEILPRY